jgi:hypothetical protein
VVAAACAATLRGGSFGQSDITPEMTRPELQLHLFGQGWTGRWVEPVGVNVLDRGSADSAVEPVRMLNHAAHGLRHLYPKVMGGLMAVFPLDGSNNRYQCRS